MSEESIPLSFLKNILKVMSWILNKWLDMDKNETTVFQTAEEEILTAFNPTKAVIKKQL